MATFTLYLPDNLVPLIDEARNQVSRSGWIRLAVENQLADRETVELRGAGPGGEPVPPPAEAERSPVTSVELSPEAVGPLEPLGGIGVPSEPPQEPSKAEKLATARQTLSRTEMFLRATQK